MFFIVSHLGEINLKPGRNILLLVSVFLLLFQTSAGLSKTLAVPGSSPTIKGALIIAQPGDIVLVSCGTYFEHDIAMKPGVALWSGTLQPGCVTIDAQGKGQIFKFADADTNTALVGFTLKGGLAQASGGDQGGAIACINSSPRISNCVFTENTANRGGAIFIDQSSSPILANCLFEKNEGWMQGGGVHCQGAVVFRQCAFSSNTALVGGGLNVDMGSTVHLASCSFRENSAGNSGGGLHVQNAQCAITNTIFSDNWGGIGGSVLSSQDSDIKIKRSTLYRNSSDTEGCVLAFTGQIPQLLDSILAFSETTILRAGSDAPDFQGCNLFGNSNGDWVATLHSMGQKNHNISLDPQFCAPEYGNFSLQNTSACLPGNNPSGNRKIVGAFGPGCVSGDEQSLNMPSSISGFQAVKAGM